MGRTDKIIVLIVLLTGILTSGCIQEEKETTASTTTTTQQTTTTTQQTTTTTQQTTTTTQQTTTTTQQTTTSINVNPDVRMSLFSDKELYHSNELMNLTVSVNSSVNLGDVSVRFYGINAGYYRLDKTLTRKVDTGMKTITLSYTTPRCTGCAGISPGTYQINADLIYNNEVIARTTGDVEIRQ